MSLFDKFNQHRQFRTLDGECDEDNSGFLDGGVAFFVGALNALGAKTMYSCEGHPTPFLINFSAPESLVDRILEAGFFEASSCGTNQWQLFLPEDSGPDKLGTLRKAADEWTKRFKLSEQVIESALRELA